MSEPDSPLEAALARHRGEILDQLDDWLEAPMLALSAAWSALLIVELVNGVSPLLEGLSLAIWIVFGLEFTLKFVVAPEKGAYLKREWVTAVALVAPGLRLLRLARIARAAQAARGLRLLKVFASINQGMHALGQSLGMRGIGYLAAVTVLIVLVGAAGMYAFERESAAGSGFDSYATAVWWTAMLITTMGSDYWPKTTEARVLCLILALYAFATFGYVTAALASFFVGRDAGGQPAAPASASLEALHVEMVALRAEVRRLGDRIPRP